MDGIIHISWTVRSGWVANKRNFEVMFLSYPDITIGCSSRAIVQPTYEVRKETMAFLRDTVAIAQTNRAVRIEVVVGYAVAGDVTKLIIHSHFYTISPIILLICFLP